MENQIPGKARIALAVGIQIAIFPIWVWAAWTSGLGLIVDWPFALMVTLMVIGVYLQAGGLSGSLHAKLAVGLLLTIAAAYVIAYERGFETTALEIIRESGRCIVSVRYPELACVGPG